MSSSGYKIVILEFNKHWDCVDGFSRVLHGSSHQLTVLCDAYIHSCLSVYPENAAVDFILLNKDESIGHFLLRQQNVIREADMIFINTIHVDPKQFLAIPFERLTVLRVHNAFKQFSPWSHIRIPFGLMYFRKAISYFIREIGWHRSVYYFKLINAKIHFFTFLSESITAYAVSNRLVDAGRVMFSLPLLPFEPDSFIKPKDKIIIAIVGAVEKRKKDYAPVVEAFTLLFKQPAKYPVPVELHFLGTSAGSYGKEITGVLNKLKSDAFSFFYYPDDVPVELFDTTLDRAQMIISTLRVNNTTQVFGEIYGKTKFTASIGVIMKHKLIGLFPAEFEFDHDFEPHLKKYSSGLELSHIIMEFMNRPALVEESRERLIQFLAERYSQEKILAQLETFLANHVVQ